MPEKLSTTERLLLSVAPSWAASRARAQREYLQHQSAMTVLRKYEAASTGRRNDGWVRPGTSANSEIAVSASAVRNGARQLVRDNGHAANAVNVLVGNTIGTGIRPEFEAASDAGSRALTELWEQHVAQDGSGAEESGNFYARQAIGFRSIVESGSVLERRRRRGQSSFALPYQVQMLEPDFLDTTLREYRGNLVVQGKELSKTGEVLAFHIYTAHPGEQFRGITSSWRSIRVPAEQMAHAYRLDRPGQLDGVSWFAPIMTDMRDLADTRDAYQLRQKIAACYAVFVHESEPGAGTSHSGQAITDHVEPGRVESLPPGKDVTFASPPGVEGMSDFDRAQLMTIAAGLGMPYEALTGDLRNVSFLSGRMGWLAFYKNIDQWRTHTVIPRLCRRELEWFLEAAAVSRGIREPVRVHWVAPSRDLLDPGKEIKALREEMRLGALSYGDMVRMRGRDPEVVIASMERWKRELDARELYFDWDCSRFSMAGNLNEAPKEETEDA
jgi:lambda family phage portal protein